MPLNVNTFYACSLGVHVLKEGGKEMGRGRDGGGRERGRKKEREKYLHQDNCIEIKLFTLFIFVFLQTNPSHFFPSWLSIHYLSLATEDS